MANSLLIKQRQQFVRFMRFRGVAFDEIVKMLQGIGNPAPHDSIGHEIAEGSIFESCGRLEQPAKPFRQA